MRFGELSRPFVRLVGLGRVKAGLGLTSQGKARQGLGETRQSLGLGWAELFRVWPGLYRGRHGWAQSLCRTYLGLFSFVLPGMSVSGDNPARLRIGPLWPAELCLGGPFWSWDCVQRFFQLFLEFFQFVCNFLGTLKMRFLIFFNFFNLFVVWATFFKLFCVFDRHHTWSETWCSGFGPPAPAAKCPTVRFGPRPSWG